jgi:hypothetical protein
MIPPLGAVVLALALSHAVPAPHAVTSPPKTAHHGVASWMPPRYGAGRHLLTFLNECVWRPGATATITRRKRR